jgi:antibiotic biosynthesis monooxygenase (ABM) superfamily enzyme
MDNAPLKVVLTLRATDDRRAALHAWIRELLATAAGNEALQGSSVLAEGGRAFVLLRFATQTDRDAWNASPAVAAVMARSAEFVDGSPPIERTGLETWFALPGSGAAAGAPPKWKMAIVTWCALLPQIVLLSFVVPNSLPFLASVAVSTAIPVCMLTWIVMPGATRLLARWLYPRDVLKAPAPDVSARSALER